MKLSDCLKALAVVSLVAAPATVHAEGDSSKSGVGQYVDDSVISNKIRAQLADDGQLNVFEIDVTTDEGVVKLSGAVDTQAAKSRAATVASGVEGVKNVRNNLVVQKMDGNADKNEKM